MAHSITFLYIFTVIFLTSYCSTYSLHFHFPPIPPLYSSSLLLLDFLTLLYLFLVLTFSFSFLSLISISIFEFLFHPLFCHSTFPHSRTCLLSLYFLSPIYHSIFHFLSLSLKFLIILSRNYLTLLSPSV